MICERCKKVEATIHLTEIIKDVKSEAHLCENCARDIGLNSKLSNFSLSVPEMLSFLDIDELDNSYDGDVCKSCGMSFIDYNREGKMNCPDCYLYLKDSMRSVITGYHGSLQHVGKHPSNSLPSQVVEDEPVIPEEDFSVESLKKELEAAVMEERYEDAAILRDKIIEIEVGSRE